MVWFNLAVGYTPHSCLLNPHASLFLYSHRTGMEKLMENHFFPSSLPGSGRRPHHTGPHNPRRTNSSYRQRTSPLHQELPPPRFSSILRHNLHRGNPEANLRERNYPHPDSLSSEFPHFWIKHIFSFYLSTQVLPIQARTMKKL